MAILDPTNALAAVLVFVLGGAVGTAELVARYRDEPWKAVTTPPALSYIAVNALASLGALAAIKAFGWNFGLDPSSPTTIAATHILVAGFGAMALFRSSLFTVRVGTSDVGVGPSSFLTIILNAVDRNVDRQRAAAPARSVKVAMRDVSFELSKVALPLACFALMQNVPTDEQQGVMEEIKRLVSADVSDHVKAIALGLLLMNVVGEDSLKSAIDTLGDEIIQEESPP